ncbi:MAG: hypothetical protein GSR81_08365 [Desulfurococcales archaeon]|nr:hypothetical protein [Desulfurococcales archaeon]
METLKRDLTVLLVIAVFIAIIVLIAFAGSTAFWYGQIILQLIMAAIALKIAFQEEG